MTTQADGTVASHYFGYVKVVIPPSSSPGVPVHTSDVTSLGLRVTDGIGVGYFRDKKIVVPLDCRLVILVRNQAQLDAAVKTLSTTEREALCVSVDRD